MYRMKPIMCENVDFYPPFRMALTKPYRKDVLFKENSIKTE